MTSKIFFNAIDKLERIFSSSESELKSEKEWFGEFKHLLLFIIFLNNFFIFSATTCIEKPLIFVIVVTFIQDSFVFYCFCIVL